LAQHYGRDDTTVFFGAPDGRRFSPAQRARLRAAARAQFGWAADDFVVLAVGNSWVIKGFDILQAVWRSGAPTPAARLWLVGSDVQARALAPAAVRRTMHVDDIAAAYAAADLLVAPSRGETLGLPVLEAAAMGLPVLVSTCAGAAEAMPAQARVASLDPESWRQRITAMADPAARASLGHACALAAATLDHKARADAVADWILGT
jgi:glycosyltransferase involved in cell wall biosynthesis